jgi:hypothetical protein
MKKKLVLTILMVIILTFLAYSFYTFYKKNYEAIIMEKFVRENLKKEYIPKKLKVIHKLTYENKCEGMENLWGSIWNINNIKFYANLHYNKQKKGISNLQVFISTNEIPKKLDEEKAVLLMNKYFKAENKNGIECKSPVQGVTYCEKFWVESNKIKKGIVVITTSQTKFIAMCEYPKGSEEYNLSTCIRMYFKGETKIPAK